MRLLHRSRTDRFGVWSALLLLICLVLISYPANAQSYTVTDLGHLCIDWCGAAANSYAYDINDHGMVVGETDFRHDYTFPGGGGFQTVTRAFLWIPDETRVRGEMRELGTLGGWSSIARRINNDGDVIGEAEVAGERWSSYPGHVFLYRYRDQKMIEIPLPELGGVAGGLNNQGDIIGTFYTSSNQGSHAVPNVFLYRQGVLTVLGEGFGHDINDLGQIAVWAAPVIDAWGRRVNNHGDRLFPSGLLLKRGHTEATPIGTLGGESIVARDLNDACEIVGGSTTSEELEQHAFLWREGKVLDLNAHIPSDSGWVLNQATGINHRGQIVGFGRRGVSIYHRAFLLTPN